MGLLLSPVTSLHPAKESQALRRSTLSVSIRGGIFSLHLLKAFTHTHTPLDGHSHSNTLKVSLHAFVLLTPRWASPCGQYYNPPCRAHCLSPSQIFDIQLHCACRLLHLPFSSPVVHVFYSQSLELPSPVKGCHCVQDVDSHIPRTDQERQTRPKNTLI